MSLETYLAFVAACTIVLIIPGPTILLVVAAGLSHGRKAALATVPGVVLGDLAAMTLSLIGVGTLLALSAELFTVVKLLGAGYLVWLGIGMWREAPHLGPLDLAALGDAAEAGRGLRHRAFLVTLLNPKSILFFIAFLPQFVAHSSPVLPQMLILGVTFLVLAGINAAGYAWLAGGFARIASVALRRAVHRVGGTCLIAAGLLATAMRRSALAA